MTRSELAAFVSGLEPALWVQHYAYPGVLLSDRGEVMSLRSGKPRILKGTIRGRYLALSAVPKGPYIHKLMCEAFYGDRPKDAEIRHLDGNRFNNRIENLWWGRPSENAEDKRRHGTDPSGVRNPMAKLTPAKVEAMRRLRHESAMTYKQIGSLFGVSAMTAYRAVEKQSWK